MEQLIEAILKEANDSRKYCMNTVDGIRRISFKTKNYYLSISAAYDTYNKMLDEAISLSKESKTSNILHTLYGHCISKGAWFRIESDQNRAYRNFLTDYQALFPIISNLRPNENYDSLVEWFREGFPEFLNQTHLRNNGTTPETEIYLRYVRRHIRLTEKALVGNLTEIGIDANDNFKSYLQNELSAPSFSTSNTNALAPVDIENLEKKVKDSHKAKFNSLRLTDFFELNTIQKANETNLVGLVTKFLACSNGSEAAAFLRVFGIIEEVESRPRGHYNSNAQLVSYSNAVTGMSTNPQEFSKILRALNNPTKRHNPSRYVAEFLGLKEKLNSKLP